MDLQQAAFPGKDGGVSRVDDHRVLKNKMTPITHKSWFITHYIPKPTVKSFECKMREKYRERGFEGVAALLTDGEGGGASETAELPPHPLPLQGLAGLPQGELREGKWL